MLALLYAALVTARHLDQNTPQAAMDRREQENAAAVRAAQEIYARSGCSTINGQRPPDLSYLAHVDCDCEAPPSSAADASTP